MKFEFKNLGVIKEANIEINGLTILAGHNNIGKSYISRMIFSIIKSLNQYESQYQLEIEDRIDAILSEMRYEIRRTIFEPKRPEKEFSVLYRNLEKKLFDFNFIGNTNETYLKEIKKLERDIIDFISKYNKDESNLIRYKNLSNKYFSNLYNLLTETPGKDKKLISFFEQFLNTEFQKQINFEEKVTHINGHDLKLKLFDISIENEKVSNFNSTTPLKYVDSILIETPMFVHLANFFTSGLSVSRNVFTPFARRNIMRKTNLPMHLIDFVQKLRSTEHFSLFPGEGFAIFKTVSPGKFYYDPKLDNFIFEDVNGKKVKSLNMASGIKSFGTLELLFNAGFINDKSLLIIDEPEVHLHPEWQIKYAEVICKLVNKNIPVLISTHSPYMLKAFEVYSNKYDIINKLNYYLGNGSENNSRVVFSDVTNNLEPIYQKLSYPMRTLSFDS